MRLASVCQITEAIFLSVAVLYLTGFSVHRCVNYDASPAFHSCGILTQLSASPEVHLKTDRVSNSTRVLKVARSEGRVCEPVKLHLLSFTQMRYVSYSSLSLYLSILLLSIHSFLSLVKLCSCPTWILRGSYYINMAFHLLVLNLYYIAHYGLHLESNVWAAEEKMGVEFPTHWNCAKIFTLILALVRCLQALFHKFLDTTHVGLSVRNVTLFNFSNTVNYTGCPPPESARGTGTRKGSGGEMN